MNDDTPALRDLDSRGADYRVVRTKRASSAAESAALQGIELHQLLKSIVVRRGQDDYVFVLVPGDRSIDWRKLRAHLNVSRAALPDRDEAKAVTGYEPGTITPFGSRTPLPVIVDASAVGSRVVALGAGAPGVNVHFGADQLGELFGAGFVDVTKPMLKS